MRRHCIIIACQEIKRQSYCIETLASHIAQYNVCKQYYNGADLLILLNDCIIKISIVKVNYYV